MSKITTSLFILSLILVFLIGVVWQKIEKLKTEPLEEFKNEKTNLATGKLGTEISTKISPVSDSDHIRGNRNANIKIIEYLDFECRFCAEFYETVQKASVTYGDNVAIVFRHYPLDNIHPTARKKAEASECVATLGGNDAFNEFADKVFKEIPYDSDYDINEIKRIAQEASVNGSDLENCINNSPVASVVEAQYQGGIEAGVRGTPQGFVINEDGDAWLIPESLPEEQIRALIDEAMK